jgi:hypothetical protein
VNLINCYKSCSKCINSKLAFFEILGSGIVVCSKRKEEKEREEKRKIKKKEKKERKKKKKSNKKRKEKKEAIR